MKSYRILFTLTICLSFGSKVCAQDFAKDILKMYEGYNSEVFETRMDINVIQDGKMWMNKKSHVKKSGSDYWYKVDDVEMLFNSNMSIMVNHSRKTILYEESEEGRKQPNVGNLLLSDLEPVLEKTDWEFIGLESGRKHYRIIDDKDMIRQVDVYLTEGNCLLDKIVYEYNQKFTGHDIVAKIDFKGYTKKPVFKTGDFSYKKYMDKKNGQFFLKTKYQSYSLSETGY